MIEPICHSLNMGDIQMLSFVFNEIIIQIITPIQDMKQLLKTRLTDPTRRGAQQAEGWTHQPHVQQQDYKV